ncbi:MAG: ABC transporter ATP-binding protein [Cyanobacteria bacterium P01_G01_bin.19]
MTDLKFTYSNRSQPTFSNVNLTLNSGEIVLISGATGCGKSTLLNCLAGISPNYIPGELTGEIVFENKALKALQQQSVRDRARHFGILLQNVETQIFTDTVWEELAFGLENLNVSSDRIPLLVESSLREFGLISQSRWQIDKLSAGQKQRLILACVVMMGQSILLLDEPFAYLDRANCNQLRQLLRNCSGQGKGILIIEHRFDLVAGLCDRAYSFEEGVLKQGIPNYVDSKPQGSLNLSDPQATLVLETDNLSWGGYPSFPNLRLYRGEIILLQGENGCGKTTLLKLLSGLLHPQTGSWWLLGKKVADRPISELAKTVGFVLQNPEHQLFAESVEAEVKQVGISETVSNRWLEQLNLAQLRDRHPQSLSRGQKRRLTLAAVLARKPKICLLDEITVGQDPRSLELMLAGLNLFAREGGSAIVTSHDPKVAKLLTAKIIQFAGNELSS